MLRVALASTMGTSHLAVNGVCEDACDAKLIVDVNGQSHLAAVAADGAGSALMGAIGAKIAISSILTEITEHFTHAARFPTETTDITNWIVTAQQNIIHTARNFGLRPRDFACTLLGALVSERNEQVAFWQIGDGGIIGLRGEVYGLVFPPDNGEYANQTHFLTDPQALDYLQVQVSALHLDGIAMITDGLQRLAINSVPLTPYAGFFDPLFAALNTTPVATARRSLRPRLRNFLKSDKVNARTEDDKTLLLASRGV